MGQGEGQPTLGSTGPDGLGVAGGLPPVHLLAEALPFAPPWIAVAQGQAPTPAEAHVHSQVRAFFACQHQLTLPAIEERRCSSMAGRRTYGSTETAYVLEGEVIVTPDGALPIFCDRLGKGERDQAQRCNILGNHSQCLWKG